MKTEKIIFKTVVSLLLLFSFFACKQSAEEHDMSHHPVTPNGENYAQMVNDGTVKSDTMKGSPERYAMAIINSTHIHISYHSPGLKGRVIWGGLVPYGNVWVSGAHNATTIDVNQPIKIQDKVVKAGKYAFFTIPQKDKWIVILNKNTEQHLADEYDQAEDVARFEVIPENNTMVQRLTYNVEQLSENEGTISLSWEKIKIALPFEVVK